MHNCTHSEERSNIIGQNLERFEAFAFLVLRCLFTVIFPVFAPTWPAQYLVSRFFQSIVGAPSVYKKSISCVLSVGAQMQSKSALQISQISVSFLRGDVQSHKIEEEVLLRS